MYPWDVSHEGTINQTKFLRRGKVGAFLDFRNPPNHIIYRSRNRLKD